MQVQALSGALQVDSVAAGAHTLTGYVARSDDSKIAGSDAATISFTSVLPDTTKPVVVITAPRDGDTVSSTLTISANAVDDIAVAGVQFKLDGVALGAEDTSAPYSRELEHHDRREWRARADRGRARHRPTTRRSR